MLAKRIVPCLDIKDGKTVKGINFVNFRDAGDPVELGAQYSREGADELVYLDITASHEGRKTFTELVKKVAANISIPFTVGGGINELKDVDRLLSAGADKVSLNTAAIVNPDLVSQASAKFGNQCIVVAIDAKRDGQNKWRVYTHGGRNATELDAVEWAKEVARRGAGEILLTSMDCDGTKNGYDISLTKAVSDAVPIPVIASGGAGNLKHLVDVVKYGGANAVLAASIFHFGTYTIEQAKDALIAEGIPARKLGGS